MRLVYESKLKKQGYQLVAGVDEAGRGPLAGPIVAAAVILPLEIDLPGLNDSKLLSPKQREALFIKIRRQAISIGVGKVGHKLIDKLNIGKANVLAMELAVKGLCRRPDFILIDGKRYRLDLPVAQRAIVQGDRKCASIAAASIIAKVVRDRIMDRYHLKYPEYGFAWHKGYGTREHFQELQEHGPCPIHRRSFFPIRSSSRPAAEIGAPS
ncbi:MAG: ribonuclease HII [Candidatus Margulisbacteria bacterium]|nr:ribonuclease HII [Candidatus Margulisiibacteriota bacterium]